MQNLLKKLFIINLIITLSFFASCTSDGPSPVTDEDFVEYFDVEQTVTIDFGNDDVVSISNTAEGAGITINKTNNDIDIHSTIKGVEYILLGTTTNGSVRIYSDWKYQITLNEVNITSDKKPALNLQSSKRAYIVLKNGTENYLTDSREYKTSKDDPIDGPTADGEDKKGCFFSEGQMVFSGEGSLNVYGKNKHAIASDEYIRVRKTNINIDYAYEGGLHIKEYYLQDDGVVKMKSIGNNALKVREGYAIMNGGELNIETNDDGIILDYGTDPSETDPQINSDFVLNNGVVNIKCIKQNDKALGISSTGTAYLKSGELNIVIYDNANAIIAKDIQETGTIYSITNQ